jgi:transposase
VDGGEDLIMARDYRPVERDQLFLLPPDMGKWLPEDHFVWFLLAVVDQLDVSGFERNRRLGGVGRRGFDPRMLLALLIYAYAGGQRSSRRIEDLCVTDVAFRVICAQDVPDHSTIARFRQDNTAAVESLFVQVLELAGEAGLGRVGVVALDGTRLAANASHQANRRRSWLREQVAMMMAEAEQADEQDDAEFGEENPSRVDPQWANPRTRQARIAAALARTEQAAAKATAAQQARVAFHQDRVRESEQRVADTGAAAEARYQDYQQRQADAEARSGPGARPPRRPAPPPDQAYDVRAATTRLANDQARLAEAVRAAVEAEARLDPPGNLTDPDSGWMPTGKGWIQGYNTQLAVSDDQIVLAVKVTNATVDVHQFEPMMNAALAGAQVLDRGRARVGASAEPVGLLLADAGYLTHHNLTLPGPDRLIGTGKRDQLEAAARDGQPATRKSELIEQMSIRLATPDGMAAYRRRGVTVEPVNGHLKDRHGLRQFSRRGLPAVQAEAELAAATANLLKIWRRR